MPVVSDDTHTRYSSNNTDKRGPMHTHKASCYCHYTPAKPKKEFSFINRDLLNELHEIYKDTRSQLHQVYCQIRQRTL